VIRLHTAATPNGRKVSILLEELGVPYEVHAVDLESKVQLGPEFRALNPNARIPVLEDDGQVVWESGAILLHLAQKHGRFLPESEPERGEALTALFFQAAHVGPNLGRLAQQAGRPEGERNDEMIGIFLEESLRVFAVLESTLADGRAFLARQYSIADMMVYPWLEAARQAQPGFFDGLPRLRAWMDAVASRPAVARGMAIPA